MASDQARDLRQRGIAAAKAGAKEEARSLLQQSIRLEPNNEAAWLWLASVARDAAERRFSLEKLLEINPNNETALKALGALPADSGLKRIGEQKRKTASSSGEIPAVPPAQSAAANAPISVPLPAPEKITEAQRQVDALIRDLPEAVPQTVKFVRKSKRRAGESDIVVYRAYLAAGIGGILALIVIIFAVIVTTNEDAAEVVFGPSATPSQTPTITWTPTPGVTPTPSPEPRNSLTPTPPPPPGITPAEIVNLPRATPFNPQLLDRALENAVAAIYQGAPERAIPTLEAARETSFDSNAPFDPVPYYYESLAFALRGDSRRALALLEEAEERLPANSPNVRQYQAILDAAHVPVYYFLGTDAAEAGDTVRANDLFTLMEERAESAIEVEEELAPPYLYVARRYRETGQYDLAVRILNRGLAIPDLRANADLLAEKAYAIYDQGDLAEADYQAGLVLAVDPTHEGAHVLRITIALDQDNPGEAVLRAQYYLLVYPGSRRGYQLLGSAHNANGDLNLALEAFNRGLASPDNSTVTADLYVSRGDLYMAQRLYDLAREDYTQALGIQDSAPIQLKRMQAAYQAGAYAIAVSDGEDLAGRLGSQQWRAQLLQAQALIAESPDSFRVLENASSLLAAAESGAPGSERPYIYQALAQAQLGLGNTEDALTAIDSAISGGDTPLRRYLRGQILEADDQTDAAIREYQWALTLGELVPFAGQDEIEDRLAELQ